MLENWTSGDSNLTSEMVLQVLSRCPQLRTCQLLVNADFDSSRVGQPALELPFLHTFDLRYSGPLSPVVREICCCISFPKLRDLKLRGKTSDFTSTSCAPFLAAAPCLDTLAINIEIFSTSLVHFLRALPPALRSLEINGVHQPWSHYNYNEIFDDDILDVLIPSPDVPTPSCPGLEVLDLKYPCAISDQGLLRFIRSRTMKGVAVSFNYGMELDVRGELQSLLQHGLHLDLKYHEPPPLFALSPRKGIRHGLTLIASGADEDEESGEE
ncbi:hypothetical protein B0H17DRAFT_1197030 [Mycena rosella]|uniref:Uncharacterized protein n=1 Tax=Mycena rosella TaxID=1033263 RepID=A0AAD7DRH0_MYCRO|nr:hypothetical protein B0H17DRAFT_1197030 [Mycena rosella]